MLIFADMFHWSIFEEESPKTLAVPPSLHEQDDGTVLAMCITMTSSKDSLLSWIKFLEQTNPALSEIPVVFLLRTPATQIQTSEDVERGRTKSSELIN